jgi:phosphatidylglycerol lysyltransferase
LLPLSIPHTFVDLKSLAGLELYSGATLWNRLGVLMYRHGEIFYNFQGLRKFKEKFNPVWEPRYLASPRRVLLPTVLVATAALISGGVTGIVSK